MSTKLKGFLALLLAALMFGSFGIWIRELNKEMSLYQQIIFRNSFALIFALLIIIPKLSHKKSLNIKKASKKNLVAYSLLIPLTVIFYNISIVNTKIAVATFIFYTASIIFSYLIGYFVFKETPTRIKYLSLAISFLGLLFLAYPFSLDAINIGLVAGFISGILDAGSNSFRKNLSGIVDKSLLILLTTIGGIIVSSLLITYSGDSLNFVSNLSALTWILGVFFGSMLVFINYLLLTGFQNIDMSTGTIILSAELFFALLLGYIFLHEEPKINETIGGILVFIAMIIPNLPDKAISYLKLT